MNKAIITTIVTLSLCFNAFAQEVKGKDWTEEEWKKEKGSYGWVFPHIDKNADGKVTAAEYEEFQKYKKKHRIPTAKRKRDEMKGNIPAIADMTLERLKSTVINKTDINFTNTQLYISYLSQSYVPTPGLPNMVLFEKDLNNWINRLR